MGLGFGAGVRNVGSRAGNADNTIEVPSYTLFDASVRYLWSRAELQLSGTNLANKTYVAVCSSANYCNYGMARKVIATTRFHFRPQPREGVGQKQNAEFNTQNSATL